MERQGWGSILNLLCRISAFLCDSAVNLCVKAINRRDAEDAEGAQSRDLLDGCFPRSVE
jgi:hypothetical protein